MRTKTVSAVLFALFAAVLAVPMKRDIDTVTEVDTVTDYITATVWVGPNDPRASETPASTVEAFVAFTHSQAPPMETSSWSYSPPSAPSTPPAQTSTSVNVPSPMPTTSTSLYVPPPPAPTTSTTSEVPPSPAPVETQAPAPTTPTTTFTPAPAPATTSTAAPSPTTSETSAAPTGQVYTGDITYYDVSVGLGSCGVQNQNSDATVAVAADMMNKATMCGKSITISYQGNTHQATIHDTCPGCDGASLDLSPSLFQAVAPEGNGRVHGVEWWFN